MAEELHKVMGGLTKADHHTVAFALPVLTSGLGTAALLPNGTLMSSENRYLPLVQHAWNEPDWQEAYGAVAHEASGRARAVLERQGSSGD